MTTIIMQIMFKGCIPTKQIICFNVMDFKTMLTHIHYIDAVWRVKESPIQT